MTKIDGMDIGAECPVCQNIIGKMVERDEMIGALGGWRIYFQCHPQHKIIVSDVEILREQQPEAS